jgi:hypothetical protein
MEKLFGRKAAGAGQDSTDRVVPLHFFENSLLVQGNNMAVSLVFDDVLDPEKLRQSLDGLIRRDGWQRLGGRLVKNVRPPNVSPTHTRNPKPLLGHREAGCPRS